MIRGFWGARWKAMRMAWRRFPIARGCILANNVIICGTAVHTGTVNYNTGVFAINLLELLMSDCEINTQKQCMYLYQVKNAQITNCHFTGALRTRPGGAAIDIARVHGVADFELHFRQFLGAGDAGDDGPSRSIRAAVFRRRRCISPTFSSRIRRWGFILVPGRSRTPPIMCSLLAQGAGRDGEWCGGGRRPDAAGVCGCERDDHEQHGLVDVGEHQLCGGGGGRINTQPLRVVQRPRPAPHPGPSPTRARGPGLVSRKKLLTSLMVERLDDFLGHFLCVAEQHHGVGGGRRVRCRRRRSRKAMERLMKRTVRAFSTSRIGMP